MRCDIIKTVYTYMSEVFALSEKITNTKFQKIKLLKIWEILLHEAEEGSPITTVELLAKLGEMGISCARRR